MPLSRIFLTAFTFIMIGAVASFIAYSVGGGEKYCFKTLPVEASPFGCASQFVFLTSLFLYGAGALLLAPILAAIEWGRINRRAMWLQRASFIFFLLLFLVLGFYLADVRAPFTSGSRALWEGLGETAVPGFLALWGAYHVAFKSKSS